MDHLLLHCKFTHVLWSKVFLVFGIQWVMGNADDDYFSSFLHGGIGFGSTY